MIKKASIANAAFFVVIALSNLVSCINDKAQATTILLYSAPLLLAALVLYLLRNKMTPKATAWVYIAASLLSVAFGDVGNLTGAIFLCFALHLFESRRIAVLALVLTGVAISAKAVISDFTATQAINYIGGYAFIISLFWILIMKPKNAKTSTLDEYEINQIMTYLINGLSYKEIAERMDVTPSAVSKRIERAKDKAGAKSSEHLAVMMSQNGNIVLE